MSSDSKVPEGSTAAGVRVSSPNRNQPEFGVFDLDKLIPEDHRARMVWMAVERMDLGPFYAEIKSREGGAGRPALDPKMLLALWIYAISEGVGSARHLSRLCERDHPYMWICGGLKPNYHDLSDFRVGHREKLDKLFTEMLASLMKAGVLKLHRVAQDGTRVRASAGGSSFRRATTLRDRLLLEAKKQVEALARELDEDPSASSEREKAARARAAKAQLDAVERALKEMPAVSAAYERSRRAREHRNAGRKADADKKGPRVSTTDPEARVMKMADGGFRPAYNTQFSTDVDTRLIVGVDVTNSGSDQRQMGPMLDKVERDLKVRVAQCLVDGGYASLKDIDAVEAAGTQVFAPVSPHRQPKSDPYARKAADTDRTYAWRTRMKSADAKQLYKQRSATAETVNGEMRAWRGLGTLRVRGLEKVRAVMLLQALTYNVLHSQTGR